MPGETGELTRPYFADDDWEIERWHRTLRRELLDVAGPFAGLLGAGGNQRLGAR